MHELQQSFRGHKGHGMIYQDTHKFHLTNIFLSSKVYVFPLMKNLYTEYAFLGKQSDKDTVLRICRI